MFKRIEVEHFKSIPHAAVELPRICVVVGPNSAGKSNFLDVFSFLKEILTDGLDEAISRRFGATSIRQWSPSRPYNIKIACQLELEKNNLQGEYSVQLAIESSNVRVISEEGRLCGNLPIPGVRNPQNREYSVAPDSIEFTRDRKGLVQLRPTGFFTEWLNVSEFTLREDAFDELVLSSGRTPVSVDPLMFFRPLFFAISDFEKYSIFPNTLRNPQKPSRERRLLPSGENFPSIFKLIEKSREDFRKDEIVESLRYFMPKLCDVKISATAGLLWPTFKIEEKDGKRHDFNVSQVSDGTLRLLGILAALYQPNPPQTIAIEEPEQTVHPGALSLVADAIKDASHTSQVFVSTHSPDFLNHFTPNDVLAVKQSDDGLTSIGTTTQEQIDSVLEGLMSLGEVMRIEGF